MERGRLFVVGIGPGDHDQMTFRAKEVIGESEVVIGYDTYITLIEDLIGPIRRSGQQKKVKKCPLYLPVILEYMA